MMFQRSAGKPFAGRFALVSGVMFAALLSSSGASNYFTRTWQVEQGLPQNKVTAVVQTRDGYLWVGTYNGLARFDGTRFTDFDDNNTPELCSSRITSLFQGDDGTLWIGTESGNLAEYKDGHFATVPLHARWNGGKIYAITEDSAHDVWLLNEAGEIARVRDGMVLSPPSGGVSKVHSLVRGRDGTIWIERDGLVSGLADGRLTSELSSNDYVQGLCPASDGGYWVASNGGIRKWDKGKWVADFGPAPWGWSIVVNFLETSTGMLVGGTSGDGLWLTWPGRTNLPAVHLDRTNGLPSDWVISLWEDREKNLWCGTGAGLVLIRQSNLETISPPDKWQSRPVLSVLPESSGALWVGTEGAGLYRLQNGHWSHFDSAQGIRNSYIWSLAEDAAGNTWAGTWGGGLFKQTDEAFDFAPGMSNILVPMAALLFENKDLWIGTPEGALCCQGGKLKWFKDIGGQPFGDVRVMAQDASGVLWFGTAGGGLVRLQHDTFRRFRKSDGLSSDFIECLHLADDGALWIGTFGGGLDRFKAGKFSVINHNQGLPNGVIGHIEADDQGYFWMGSYGGILRASEKDLNRCADGLTAKALFLTFGINDGMPTLECSEGLQAAGGKTPDGRLWFATAKGLVALDPDGVTLNHLPPPVHIEAMIVDDDPVKERNSAGMLEIPPGRHRIEFDYTALSFVSPERVRFKCRLEKIEPDWTDAGTKRSATYNYIPPGAYTFQVAACNNDGVWNETGDRLAFEVLPFFWQTTWFHLLCGTLTLLLASGVVWFDTRRRMRRKLELAERQRDLEHERSRIARDIHDDLGAQLTRITMMSESARGEVANPERAAAGLEKIYSTARELTRSMDEIVWAVNPRHDTLESLATYLEKFAHDWLAGVGIRCRLDLPLQFPEWHLSSEVRHNLFLGFKEALHNTVKHSGATEVLIRLVVKDKSFELTVEDNGRGFVPEEKRPSPPESPGRAASGNGLGNMTQRLVTIGGKCKIQSAPDKGTRVAFSVQLNASALEKPGH